MTNVWSGMQLLGQFFLEFLLSECRRGNPDFQPLQPGERLPLMLSDVRVLGHDPLDQDRQDQDPLILQPAQLVEGGVAHLE